MKIILFNCILQSKLTREMGCQTEPVITRSNDVQANLKPTRRSKGEVWSLLGSYEINFFISLYSSLNLKTLVINGLEPKKMLISKRNFLKSNYSMS